MVVGDYDELLLLLLLLQFTNNTKEPKANEFVFVGLLCALTIIIFEWGNTLLVLGFSTVQKSIDLEGSIANATYDLTESIGKFLFEVLLWA